MIVGMMTDFEMTFTGDLFKRAKQNNDFVFKVSVNPHPPPTPPKKKKKLAIVP